MDAAYLRSTKGLFLVTSGLGGVFVVDAVALTVTPEPAFEIVPGKRVFGHCLLAPVPGGRGKRLFLVRGPPIQGDGALDLCGRPHSLQPF
jgi:hypothetical protein